MPVDLTCIEYLAFEGGGGMGLAYVGSLAALKDCYKEEDLIGEDGLFCWPVKGISGASAGAINALMMALDYTPEETSNLMVRDGLFAQLFSEKIKLEYHRGVVSSRELTTGFRTGDFVTSGWYGNSNRRANQTDGLQHLNREFDEGWPKPGPATATPKPTAKAENAPEKPLTVRDIVKLLNNPTEADWKHWSNLGNAAIRWLNLPSSKIDLAGIFAGIAVAAGVRYLAGEGNVDAPVDVDRFVRLLNEEASKRLKDRNPAWSIGTSKNSGWEFWGLLAVYPGAAILVLAYVLLLKGRVREGKERDLIKQREDLGRPASAQARKRVGKNDTDYMLGLLLRIWWHNLLRSDFHRVAIKHVLNKKTVGQIIKLLQKPDTDERKADQKKALEGLEKIGWSLIPLLLKAPFTEVAVKAVLHDGGLLQGDVTRDLLTTVVFNKYYVVADEAGTGWELKKRSEALETTLGRVAADALNLTAITEAVAPWDPRAEPGRSAASFRSEAYQRTVRKEVKESAAARDKALAMAEEYDELKQCLGEERADSPDADLDCEFASMATLEAEITRLRAIAVAHNLLGERIAMPIREQISKIKSDLTFTRLLEATRKDLVIAGTNISTSQPVYFRAALTPDFPVVDAVAMSASFPFLFRPTAVRYRAPPGKGREPAFYDIHYSGYFIDGGVFNNLPINAFNGEQADARTGAALRSPQELLSEKFNGNVLAFELTNDPKDQESVFEKGYKAGEKHRDIKAVLEKGLMGSFYAMGGPLQRAQDGMDGLVVRVAPGNLGLFDMVPDYYAIADMFGHNYETTYQFITGKPSQLGGRDSAMGALGDFSKFNSADPSERRKARRAKRAWDRNRQVRKALMQDLR
ncbi:MAG: patatin-like phospholipase family protein [Caulobacteraceae bacterium]|nr:patatin-like phospholipase family protein [Caulobacteraceae bacterium]